MSFNRNVFVATRQTKQVVTIRLVSSAVALFAISIVSITVTCIQLRTTHRQWLIM